MTGSVTWSVSGGGTVSTTGLFTAPGTAGMSTVFAVTGALRDSALVTVGAGCQLATGFFKQLLCLEDASGTPYLNTADATGIDAAYTGTSAALPAEGVQIAVNGRTYTWHLRTSSNGVWANSSSGFIAYWFTSVSGAAQQVKASVIHDDDAWVWNNGTQVGNLSGWTSTEVQTSEFALSAGANNLLFKLSGGGGGNSFSARLVTPANTDVSGLTYSPCAGTTVAGMRRGVASSALSTKTRISVTSGGLRINVPTTGAHSISLVDAQGKTIRVFRGSGAAEYGVGTKALRTGMYFVRISAGLETRSTQVVVTN